MHLVGSVLALGRESVVVFYKPSRLSLIQVFKYFSHSGIIPCILREGQTTFFPLMRFPLTSFVSGIYHVHQRYSYFSFHLCLLDGSHLQYPHELVNFLFLKALGYFLIRQVYSFHNFSLSTLKYEHGAFFMPSSIPIS